MDLELPVALFPSLGTTCLGDNMEINSEIVFDEFSEEENLFTSS